MPSVNSKNYQTKKLEKPETKKMHIILRRLNVPKFGTFRRRS